MPSADELVVGLRGLGFVQLAQAEAVFDVIQWSKQQKQRVASGGRVSTNAPPARVSLLFPEEDTPVSTRDDAAHDGEEGDGEEGDGEEYQLERDHRVPVDEVVRLIEAANFPTVHVLPAVSGASAPPQDVTEEDLEEARADVDALLEEIEAKHTLARLSKKAGGGGATGGGGDVSDSSGEEVEATRPEPELEPEPEVAVVAVEPSPETARQLSPEDHAKLVNVGERASDPLVHSICLICLMCTVVDHLCFLSYDLFVPCAMAF